MKIKITKRFFTIPDLTAALNSDKFGPKAPRHFTKSGQKDQDSKKVPPFFLGIFQKWLLWWFLWHWTTGEQQEMPRCDTTWLPCTVVKRKADSKAFRRQADLHSMFHSIFYPCFTGSIFWFLTSWYIGCWEFLSTLRRRISIALVLSARQPDLVPHLPR